MSKLIINQLLSKRNFLVFFLLLFILSCSNKNDNPVNPPVDDKGDYSLKTKYDSIRSYPDGGGIFIVYISPQSDFAGTVNLKLIAEPKLNAKLTKTALNNHDSVAEITIKPDPGISFAEYPIKLVASHLGKDKNIYLNVNVIDWMGNNENTKFEKRDEFKAWVLNQKPGYAKAFESPDYTYVTYPQILVVEHHTMLSNEFETRICFHVMIPPDDWSMICIRRRGAIEPEFAAKRLTDGTINEIPVSDYPKFFGY